MRLCIAGGGTGGHVMPALALADAARTRWPELTVGFIGAERGLEAKLLPERGEAVMLLPMHAVQGAGVLQKLKVLLWELPRAVRSIRRAWGSEKPDLLVGVGGYASVSGVAAALISSVPVILYEQNAMPGLVNRTLARFCRGVMLGFADAAKHLSASTHVTGNIVRTPIAAVRWQPHQPPRLLVLGGSQGALVLNRMLPEACAMLAREGREFVVTHVCGRDEAMQQQVRETYAVGAVRAEVLPFCDDMPAFYGSGDLMVARSGAMTVSEAAACGMPALFVPLPHAADDHQRCNAETLANSGAARVLNQRELTAESLAAEIESVLFDSEGLAKMSEAALRQSPAAAGERQLDVLAPYLNRMEAAA